MKIEKIFNSVFKLNVDIYDDDRGFFYELYNKKRFKDADFDDDFIQDNISFSKQKHTIRGLHYQKTPYEQTKLIYILSGSILDIFVDIRQNSNTFGQYGCIELSKPGEGLYIPKGFLHGFCTLEPNTLVSYKVDTLYQHDSEIGVIWNDKDLSIKWPSELSSPIISDKDNNLFSWRSFLKEMNYHEK